MKKQWLFLNNTFEAVTRESYRKAYNISTYTDAALQADPATQALYLVYHPLHVAFTQNYQDWKKKGGSQKGHTATLNDLLYGLTAALNGWDAGIQQVYPKESPNYLSFFPQGHEPFTHGGQNMRIAAVATLAKAMTEDGSLGTVSVRVSNYLNDLQSVQNIQKQSISLTDSGSDTLEESRIALCDGLYAALGSLMNLYSHNRDHIATFFRLELIRNEQQTTFTGSVPAGGVHNIVKRKLDADDEVVLHNMGVVPVRFFLAATEVAAAGTAGIEVQPGASTTTTAAALGNAATDACLMVSADATVADGFWEVDL